MNLSLWRGDDRMQNELSGLIGGGDAAERKRGLFSHVVLYSTKIQKAGRSATKMRGVFNWPDCFPNVLRAFGDFFRWPADFFSVRSS